MTMSERDETNGQLRSYADSISKLPQGDADKHERMRSIRGLIQRLLDDHPGTAVE